MVKRSIYICLALVAFMLFLGCSDKKRAEFNKPAIYWYQNMIKDIKNGEIEAADDKFSSLSSEHINSPLVPDAMLILAKAHMDIEEYLLADFYLDEFIKRFATQENIEFAKALKIKTNYLSFRLSGREQQLIIDTIKAAEEYIVKHPYSKYRPYVDSMLFNLYLGNLYLDREIASLYGRLDKPEASEYYMNKYEYNWLKDIVINEPDISWYREIFNW